MTIEEFLSKMRIMTQCRVIENQTMRELDMSSSLSRVISSVVPTKQGFDIFVYKCIYRKD